MSLLEGLRRLRFWRRRELLAGELEEELEAHVEFLARDFEQAGLPREAALAAARRQLGSTTRIREASRDQWGFPWLDALLQDLRYCLRSLRMSPGFSASVILTLGLAVGANAVMFGVVDRLMLRPFPQLRDPDRVHRVYLRSNHRNREQITSSSAYARYLDLRRWTTSFEAWSGLADRRIAVGSGDATREVTVTLVNAEFFDFFDAPPALGRYFLPDQDQTPRGAPVVVLAWGYWQSEYGGRNVLGERLYVGPISCVIIGVAPRGFTGVDEGSPTSVYLPITTYAGNHPSERNATTYFTRYNWDWMEMMVRRKPDVSVAQASADLSNAFLRSWNAERELGAALAPAEVARPTALAAPLKSGAGPDASLEARTALWVSGVAAIVLVIACANLANLFLARALRRRRETAVRLALGVTRTRLLGQHLMENVVLVLSGTVAGLLIAQGGGSWIRKLFVAAAPLDVVTDWRTIGTAAVMAVVVALLTGLAPALIAVRGGPELAASLKAGAREGSHPRSRLRSALLVAQGALSVMLLVGAGLFVQSLRRVNGLRLGFDAGAVLLAEPKLRGTRLTPEEEIGLGRRVLEQGQALPGVEHAAWAGSVPFYSTSGTGLYVPGIDSVQRLGQFSYQVATPDYFATMGTRIVRGRPFTAQDRAGGPLVGVVSESMARVLWPGRDPIGQCMRVGSDTVPCTTVVGVAEDAFQRSLVDDQRLHYYLPLDQFRTNEGFALLLRVRGDPALQAEAVRRQLQPLMPGQAYVVVRPLDELLASQRRSWRFGATMFSAFGLLALLVAAVGLYGVLAYNVAQRMHELGVRMALGARPGQVVRLVMGQGIRYALLGTAIGTVLAFFAGRWLQPILFQVSARDLRVFGLVAALLLLVAGFATAAPARRASRADPNTALRAE
jgi:predicted permease